MENVGSICVLLPFEMRSFKKKLLLYGVFAALYCVSGAARILDKAGARISTHFDTSINDLKELFKERFESASTEHKRLHENEHHAKKTLHNILECDKLTTLGHLVGDEVDCDHGEFATKWNILSHLLNKMESPLKEKNRNDKKETAKDVAEKILKLGKIVDFFVEKALKLDSMDLLKDLMKLRLIFHKKDKGISKIGDWKKFVDEVIEIGTKLHKLEEKHEKDSDSENRKNIFEHLKDKNHGDFLSHIKEIEKLLTARGVAHETEHIAKKGKELEEKLVEGIKHVLGKNKIFHKIDNEGDFFKHVFEKVFKHDKKESKVKFVEDALQNEKKILEGAEHIVEKGKKIDVTLHGFEHNTEKLIGDEKQDILDKISEHSPEDEEEDEAHFFRHIKEIGEKIHELMHHERHRGENIKHDLFEHIKNILTKIFKIAETHKQKWGRVHISEFLHDLKKIGKEIHEMKEKHEEKEGKNHHGLFKYIEEVGKIIHQTLEKHDKNRQEDHIHHIKGIGEKLLTKGGLAQETKHLAEKEKEKIGEIIEHILDKSKIFHKTDNEGDFIKHVLEKLPKHDEKEDKDEFFKDTIENGKNIVEGAKHLVGKGKKIENTLDGFEHITEKRIKHKKHKKQGHVFKHNPKDDGDDERHFLRHIKQIGEKIHEIIHHIRHSGGDIKHDLFEHIEKIGTIIFKMVETHDKIRGKVHIDEFLQDLKDIKKVIHEIKEKHEEKEGIIHHGLFKYIEKVGKLIHHILEKHDKLKKEDHKGDVSHHIRHLEEKGKKVGDTLDGFEHITEELMKHKKQDHDQFHIFDKVFKHNSKDNEDDDGHFFRHIKEVGVKIHEMIHHIRHSGGDIKHDLFEHIKKIGTIIFKIVKIHDKIGGKVHIGEFLQDLKDIKKVIHEIKEKYEEKEGKIHHGLFKYIEEVGKLIHHILEKHDKIRNEDHKGDVFHHIKHLVEKGKKVGHIVDGFEHIVKKLIKHKKHDHDEFHIFDKVFKLNSKDDEDDEGHFFRHIKEIGEKIHEIIHHIRHSGGDIKHDLFEHIKKIGTIIFKIVKIHDKIGGKVHIGEFLQDLKDIKKVIHEIKEKYEEKEGKIHHGLFKYIEEVGKLIHHILEKHDKIRNEDHKGDVFHHIKHLVEKGKKVGHIVDGFEHIVEKLIKHKKHDHDEFHIFDKVFKLNSKVDEDDEGHFFRHIKEIGEKIHEVIHHIRHSGGDIKHDLFEHIQKIGTIIFKIVETHDKIRGKVHIDEFLQDLKDIKKVIHEIKEKHEEKEGKIHHGLFKYIEEVGKLIHHILEKHDKIRKEDHKGDVFHHIKHLVEKGKEMGDIVDGFEHIVEKLIKHKKHDHDEVHIFDKVFKLNSKDDEDDEGHFFRHIKEIEEKIHEMIHHIRHSGGDIKHDLFEHIKKIGRIICRIVEIHDKLGDKVHIGEFVQDLKDIKKVIHEIKEKHEEKECKSHHGLFKHIEEVGKLIHHILEKHEKMRKEDHKGAEKHHKGEFIEDTLEIGKNMFEDTKKVIKKGKQIDETVEGLKHELENEGDFTEHLLEKVCIHDKKDDEKHLIKNTLIKGTKLAEGIYHILEEKKEFEKLLLNNGIKYLLEKGLNLSEIGDEGHFFKYLFDKLFKHIKKDAKEDFIVEKLEHGKEFFEGVKHVLEKEKETDEKLVEEFKHFIDKKEILDKVEKECDIIKHVINKEEFIKDAIEGGKKFVVDKGKQLGKFAEDVKHVIEKGKEINEKLVDGFKHILHKGNILHKLDYEGDFIKHLIEKELIEDALEEGKKLIEGFKHIKEKEIKLHAFEHEGEFMKHVFEKVFKHDKKGDKEECIEDSIEEEEECFEDDIKEKLKKKRDAFKHFIEFVGAEHKGHFIKHLLEEKFEHGKDKIEEYLHRFGIKLHEVKEFFKDLMHKKHATLEKISDDIGSDEQKNAVHKFLKLIGSFDKGKIEKHDGREKEKLLSESKHVLHKVSAAVHSIETPLSHSGEFLKRILPKKKVVDCCPCECCCCGQDGNNNCNQGGTSNRGFTYKAGEEFDELYSNPNVHDQGFYIG